MSEAPENLPAERTLKQARAAAVLAIANDLRGVLTPGDVSALRRLSPEDPASPAFFKVVTSRLRDLLPASDAARDRAERRWAIVLRAMASLGPELLVPRARLGRACAQANVAEPRVLRLLRAEGDALADALRYVTHQLASRAEPVDPVELAELVLSDGEPWGESVRRRIARDFYAALGSTESV